jgi:hypothetical protein
MTFLGTFCVGQEHIGDEFHYLFECTYFERERKQLLPNIQKSDVLIYHDLFNDNDINEFETFISQRTQLGYVNTNSTTISTQYSGMEMIHIYKQCILLAEAKSLYKVANF